MIESRPHKSFSLEMMAIIFIVVVVFAYTGVVMLLVDSSNKDFYQHHVAISKQTTKDVAAEIERMLEQKRKVVRAFVENNHHLISKVIDNINGEHNYEILNKKLNSYFYDYFSSNVATESAELIIDDFDGYIGELCILDIKNYIHSGVHHIRVHPNPKVYHYDVVARFKHRDRDYLFFVSFSTSEIDKIIKLSQPEQHELIVLNNDLIEITALGDRRNIPGRNDYRITEKEKDRILSSARVKNSLWRVADLRGENLFIEYKNNKWNEVIFILFGFYFITAVVSAALFFVIRRKQHYEQELVDKNQKIVLLNSALEELSATDRLTRSYNRGYFDQHSSLEWNKAVRNNLVVNIALFDVDYFKQYNDSYGHQKGDECLIEISELLMSCFRRANEFVARYGGEEFVLFNMGEDPSELLERLNDFSGLLTDKHIAHNQSSIAEHVTMSIGVASLRASNDFTVKELIARSDKALYQAKDKGRNTIVCYGD